MIEMFTKLFEINTVANKIRGLSIKSIITLSVLLSLSLSSSRWAGEREKNATSEPEIMAEKTKRMAIKKRIGAI